VISDEFNDMAIIKISDEKFTSVQEIPYRFDTQTKDVGTEVFTLGYPMTDIMGTEPKYTKGEISAKSGYQGDIRTYQVSVPMTYGNSGGPLFDYDGNVIGITSGGLKKGIADNVNYAIKILYLNVLIETAQDKIVLPKGIDIRNKTNPEKIKMLQDFVVFVKIKY
jgi:S1-C subfamily serine protease